MATETENAASAASRPITEAEVVAVMREAGVPKRRWRMNFRRTIILPLLLLALLGYGGYKGWQWYSHGRHVISTDDAYVKADMAVIAAKVSGYLVDVPVKDGQEVKAGDVLVRIDDGDYRLAETAAREKIGTQDATIARIVEQVKAQTAQIEQSRAVMASAEADLRRAEANFGRIESLAKTQVTSQANFDTARADRDRALAVLASSRAAFMAAEAAKAVVQAQGQEAQSIRAELQTQLEKAVRDRSFTEVKAPFGGMIGNKAAQTGAFVQPGSRLMALVPLESVYVEANFKETQIAKLRIGQKVDVSVDAFATTPIEGQIVGIAPASGSQFSLLPPDNATGNFTKIVQRVPVKISVPAQVAREGRLRPGLSVEVGVHTRENTP